MHRVHDDEDEDDDESSSLEDDTDAQNQHPQVPGAQQEFSEDDDESSAMSDYNPDERVRNLINNRNNEPEIVSRGQGLRNRPPLPHQQRQHDEEDEDDDSSSEYSFEESPAKQRVAA